MDWNISMNHGLTPFDVSYGDSKNYWFKCIKCGYEYQTSPKHKSRGTKCKRCHDRRVRTSKLIMEVYPELAAEYSNINNKPLNEVTHGLRDRSIWNCTECKHEWETTTNSRTWSKSGCPNCHNNWYTNMLKRIEGESNVG